MVRCVYVVSFRVNQYAFCDKRKDEIVSFVFIERFVNFVCVSKRVMKVSVIQQDIIWGDPEQNIQHLDSLLAAAEHADLYVLPEMFTTGFATYEETKVEGEASVGVQWMKGKAAEMGAAIAGSVAFDPGDGKLVNRLFFVRPDGSFDYYDKKHLFRYGGEHQRFNAGDSRVVVEYMGVRIMLAVCYDLRFPVWLRNRGDYDVLLVVANWPQVRRYAWDTLVRARAIENQCFVLACTRVGKDPECEYWGGSAILGPYGEELEVAPDHQECIITHELDMKHLREYVEKFPVLTDADAFTFE